MTASALTFGLFGLAAASPIADRRAASHYPETSSSKGFRLVINVTDPCKDFNPPIQNTYIASIHTGAGLALVGNHAGTEYARIFYENGTAEEHSRNEETFVSDGGTPLFPSGLKLVKDSASADVSTAHLDAGPGTKGVGISPSSEPYAFLTPETYVACNESLAYYQGAHFIVIKQAATVPDGCAPVRLLPECTELNALPSGSYSSHDFAIEDRCYKDVASIKWSEYSP